MTRKLLFLLIAAIAAVMPAAAQSKADREAWMKEMTRYKHEFLTRELKLTEQQQKQFFALYDAMEAETRKLVDNTRRMEKSVLEKGDKATDLEREKAAEALFEMKGKESQIEMRYFPKFKEVLNPAQLLKLKQAERHFNRQIIKDHKHHREARKACKKK